MNNSKSNFNNNCNVNYNYNYYDGNFNCFNFNSNDIFNNIHNGNYDLIANHKSIDNYENNLK